MKLNKYETPEIVVTSFEVERMIMDNEGPGDIVEETSKNLSDEIGGADDLLP